METKKKKISLYIEPENHEKIKELSKKQSRSTGSLIRYLIDNYIKEETVKEERIKRVFNK